MDLFTKPVIIDTARRAINTFVQTLLVLIGSEAFDIISADWQHLLVMSSGAAFLSILNSVKNATLPADTLQPAPEFITSPRAASRRLREIEAEKAELVKITTGESEE